MFVHLLNPLPLVQCLFAQLLDTFSSAGSESDAHWCISSLVLGPALLSPLPSYLLCLVSCVLGSRRTEVQVPDVLRTAGLVLVAHWCTSSRTWKLEVSTRPAVHHRHTRYTRYTKSRKTRSSRPAIAPRGGLRSTRPIGRMTSDPSLPRRLAAHCGGTAKRHPPVQPPQSLPTSRRA